MSMSNAYFWSDQTESTRELRAYFDILCKSLLIVSNKVM